MMVREKSTGKSVAAKQIENDVQIGRWLAGRNLIEPPLPFAEPPHVGEPGDWVVSAPDDRGFWSYEVISEDEFDERFEFFPEPSEQ